MASSALRGTDGVMAQLAAIARKMGGGHVNIGFLASAKAPDGTPMAALAFWNEFGHGGPFPAPPRSFFRTMIAKESPNWPGQMAKLAKQQNFDGPTVLGMMGADVAAALQESITETNTPPLSDTTRRLRFKFGNKPEDITLKDVRKAAREAAKGLPLASGTQAKPLVWTGNMRNSVAYEVKK